MRRARTQQRVTTHLTPASPRAFSPASSSSNHSPNLVVFGSEVSGARECGVASSERVGVTVGEVRVRSCAVAAFKNAKVMSTAEGGSIIWITVHRLCSVGAVEARGRVVVRILDQEQKTAVGSGIRTTSISPRRAGVGAKRVARGRAHDDQRRPLPSQRYAAQP
jgi:hypothetical protein